MASGRLEGQEEEEEEEKGRRISRLGEDCGKERKGESFSLASSSSSFLPKPISFPFSGLYAKGLSRFCCCFCRLLSDSLLALSTRGEATTAFFGRRKRLGVEEGPLHSHYSLLQPPLSSCAKPGNPYLTPFSLRSSSTPYFWSPTCPLLLPQAHILPPALSRLLRGEKEAAAKKKKTSDRLLPPLHPPA